MGRPAVCIIGGGKSQVPFIDAAAGRGLDTIVFDVDPDAPGKRSASRFHPISTHDTDAVLTALMVHEEDLVGSFTYSSFEAALRTAAAVNDRFGLPGLTLDSLETMWSKPAMLEALAAQRLTTGDWTVTDDFSRLQSRVEAGGRLIVKPARGGVGSLGVALVDASTIDVRSRFDEAIAASSDGKALIEAFHSGVEYSVDGYIQGGAVRVLMTSRKHSLGPDAGFVMAGFVSGPGAVDPETQGLLARIAEEAIAAARIDDSFFSLDVLVDDGVPYVVDVGPLLDAKVDRLLAYSGLDVYGLAVDLARATPWQVPPVSERSFGLRFLYAAAPGTLAIDDPSAIQGVPVGFTIEFERSPGDQVGPPGSVSDVVGWVMGADTDADRLWADLSAVDLTGLVTGAGA